MNTRNDLRPRGARHSGAKLNDAAVMEIRRLHHGDGYTMAKLAEIYGCGSEHPSHGVPGAAGGTRARALRPEPGWD